MKVFENCTISFENETKASQLEISLKPKKMIQNGRKFIVLWGDNTRTVSTCTENDTFDLEVAFGICLAKKIFGKTKYRRMLKKVQVQENLSTPTYAQLANTFLITRTGN